MKATVYLILFRGVGGKTQLPVKLLRKRLKEAGFENVATYINSGNAIVHSRLNRTRDLRDCWRSDPQGRVHSIVLRDRAIF